MDVDPLTGSISVQATNWVEGGGLPYKPIADPNNTKKRLRSNRKRRSLKGGDNSQPKRKNTRVHQSR